MQERARAAAACAQLSGVLHSEQLSRETFTVDLETLLEEVFVEKKGLVNVWKMLTHTFA